MRRRRRQEPTSVFDAYEGMRADYAAARSNRFRRIRSGIPSSGAHADYHYRNDSDYLRMMEYARDFDRNDANVGYIVNRAVTNILQGGIKLDPATGDPGLDADLLAHWKAWAIDPEQCDRAGEHNFNSQVRLALRQMFVDGDVCFLPDREEGALEAVEAHRLRTPTNTSRPVVHGVLLNKYRRRLEYWFTKEDVAPSKTVRLVSDMRPYPVRDNKGYRQVFHVYNPRRISQTRGVTAFAPVFDKMGMLEDIEFAKLVQQQVVSCFAFFREREIDFSGGTPPTMGDTATETLSDSTTRTVEGVAPGMEVTGAPGEKLQGFSPSVPNPEYFPHIKQILTTIGNNLGLPLVLVTLDASETNFSGWRGAVDQARIGFREMQQRLIERLYRPTYVWKLRQWHADDSAIRRAAMRSGIDVFAHNWNPPTWPYIEPLKDAQADSHRLENGLISPRRLHAERGQDWDDVAAEIVEDRAIIISLAIAKADEINGQSVNAGVTWRDLAALPQQKAQPAKPMKEDDDGSDDA